jgi:hypothetical protein
MGSTTDSEDKVGFNVPYGTVSIAVEEHCSVYRNVLSLSKLTRCYRSSKICRRMWIQQCWKTRRGPLRRESVSIMRAPREDSLTWYLLDQPWSLWTQLTNGIDWDQFHTPMHDFLNKSPQCYQYSEELSFQDI